MTYDSTADTQAHIARVQALLQEVVNNLTVRAAHHDESKLTEPEKSAFDRCTPLLRETTYGTPEYTAAKKQLGEALQHHYAHNSHHPEFYENGIAGMSLLDIVEMTVDWVAACERVKDGDIWKSLEHNKQYRQISDQLYSILVNTVREMGWG
jgi:hypothetical protein